MHFTVRENEYYKEDGVYERLSQHSTERGGKVTWGAVENLLPLWGAGGLGRMETGPTGEPMSALKMWHSTLY